MDNKNYQTEEASKGIADRPSPVDFDTYLPWACGELTVDAFVVINRTYRNAYVPQSGKERSKAKSKFKVKQTVTETETGSNESLPSQKLLTQIPKVTLVQDDNIYIEAVYDHDDKLVQLKFNENNHRKIPRLIFKIIGLILRFHTSLSSIVINRGLHAAAIYEISKLIPKSNITEICLDRTNVPEGNYHLLLRNDNLKHLSLSKCNINDDTIKVIASELSQLEQNSKLCALNLATNQITDVGAKYLAEVLQFNRNLAYLNLSDNMIGDDGAISIFNTLKEFPLTLEETFGVRSRLMARLKERNELMERTLKTLQLGDLSERRPSRRKSAKPPIASTLKKKHDSVTVGGITKSAEKIIYERAEVIVEELMGPMNNPFSSGNVELRGSTMYCLGNNTLSYLNIAYNNLSVVSIKKLCDVLKRQKYLARNPRGLINVVIEGNYLADDSLELKIIDDILGAYFATFRKTSDAKKKSMSSKLSTFRKGDSS